MRTKCMMVLAVLVLAAMNYGIYRKEQIREHGTTLLLELAPADPRSLVQGDYMRLGYALGRQDSDRHPAPREKRGYLVISPDENRVARFLRVYQGEDLADGEKLLRFHRRFGSSWVRIVPDSYFFQEGHARYYENAKYGLFKFDESGKQMLLVGLADEQRREIRPPAAAPDGSE